MTNQNTKMAPRLAPLTVAGDGGQPLPRCIYNHHGKFSVKISVRGKQYFFGRFDDLPFAEAERDRALHALRPWVRPTAWKAYEPIAPESDLLALPPNELLNEALSELRSLDSESEKAGMVPTALSAGRPAQAAPSGDPALERIASALESIDHSLRSILQWGIPQQK